MKVTLALLLVAVVAVVGTYAGLAAKAPKEQRTYIVQAA